MSKLSNKDEIVKLLSDGVARSYIELRQHLLDKGHMASQSGVYIIMAALTRDGYVESFPYGKLKTWRIVNF